MAVGTHFWWFVTGAMGIEQVSMDAMILARYTVTVE
jgi:hypothetical protein